MRSLAGLALAVLVTVAAGCSGGGAGYCELLADATETLTTADPAAMDQAALDGLRATATELEEAAPGMVVDDWRVVVASYTSLDTTLREAGLSADDLVRIQRDGSTTDRELLEKFGEVSPKLDEIMSSNELLIAGDAIAEHAGTECDVDMTP
jgi:hypothetical protein